MRRPYITYRIGEGSDALVQAAEGREAWALLELLKAGERGITSFENPAPRLSHYIMKLRRAGLDISMTEEAHAAPFPGWHGRYHLRSKVFLLDLGGQATGAAA